MCTYLGAGAELDPSDVDADRHRERGGHVPRGLPLGRAAGEGRDPPRGRRSRTTPDRRVALTLSDPFCVERHRDEFRELVENDVDILFANEHEITMLYEVDDFDEAAAAACAGALRDRRAHARARTARSIVGRRRTCT